MGLPSGLKWATCNIGASSPEEAGLYFAWGETKGYMAEDVKNGVKKFCWTDYKYSITSSENGFTLFPETLTKYFWEGGYEENTGTPDGLVVLELSDDAAYQCNNTCRMPTYTEVQELLNNTTMTDVTTGSGDDAVLTGWRLTSNMEGYTDKFIFIPASGYGYNNEIVNVGSNGGFWSSSLCTDYDPQYALSIDLGWMHEGYGRRTGMNIRPVYKGE